MSGVVDKDTDWDEVRAYLDNIGLEAVQAAVAAGVPREVAGQRVAQFNDIVIETLQAKIEPRP